MNRMLSIVKRAERAERNLFRDAKRKPIAASLVSLLWVLVFMFSLVSSFGFFLFLSSVLALCLSLSTFGKALSS